MRYKDTPSRKSTVVKLRWSTIAELHKAGDYSLNAIGRVVGLRANTVRHALIQMGVYTPQPEGRRKGDPTNIGGRAVLRARS